MSRPWLWPLWLRRLLGLHSPSGEAVGRCWCQLDANRKAHREAQSKGYER